MGKLTNEVFNEACCDGGAASTNAKSCQPCGCDEGAGWTCKMHTKADAAFDIEMLRKDLVHPYPPLYQQEVERPTNPKKMNRLKKHYLEVVSRLWNAAERCETDKDHFLNAALGLAAEAGEVADIHKKHFYHKVNDKYREELLLELGDVYFYLLKVQALWGFTTKEILKANKDKLFKRYGVDDAK